MDEIERHKQKLTAPMRTPGTVRCTRFGVFDQLISDSHPNLTNVLIVRIGKIWRVDFTRAFRQNKEAKAPKDLVRCDRPIAGETEALDAERLTEKTSITSPRTK